MPSEIRREPRTLSSRDAATALARRWLFLATGSLLLSGLLALFLAAARTPFLDALIDDPLFFRRSLVVHVDLALLVWIYSAVAALFALLPTRRGPSVTARASVGLGLVGVVLLVVSAGAKGSAPVLANYVPVVDHPLFLAGLAAFGGGVLLALLDRRLLPGSEEPRGAVEMPEAARVALRTSAIAILAALLTFAGSWVSTPASSVPEAYYETLFWGGGHVLQVASVAAMAACWLMLVQPLTTREVLSRRLASLLFACLALPTMLAPLLALQGPSSPYYRIGFTWMMQWGIFPAITIVLFACGRALVHARKHERLRLKDPRLLGFATSAGLTVMGFVLGAMIRGSNTMVPAHYHAAIGAVTASFMAVSYILLPALGVPVAWPRIAKAQPVLFGFGQAVFAVGFGLAGSYGMGRKVYGAEQLHRSLPETIGLAVMGLGGLIAAAGGIAFLANFLVSYRRAQASGAIIRSHAWIPKTENTLSRS